ncbi:hypothetical protein NPIL_148281, partial [Nephila pilipes]
MAENLKAPVMLTRAITEYRLGCVQFIKNCAKVFHWKDLSEDVIMDIGCGEEMNCCNTMLEEYPNVKGIIAVDNELAVYRFVQTRRIDKIHACLGDIEKRESLSYYEGKMNKVISTSTFHHIQDKELAFQNVFHLLKPNGEAAFYFYLDNSFQQSVLAMLKVPMFKEKFKGLFNTNKFPAERRSLYYKEMLERIGFHNVRSMEEMRSVPFSSDKHCL